MRLRPSMRFFSAKIAAPCSSVTCVAGGAASAGFGVLSGIVSALLTSTQRPRAGGPDAGTWWRSLSQARSVGPAPTLRRWSAAPLTARWSAYSGAARGHTRGMSARIELIFILHSVTCPGHDAQPRPRNREPAELAGAVGAGTELVRAALHHRPPR